MKRNDFFRPVIGACTVVSLPGFGAKSAMDAERSALITFRHEKLSNGDLQNHLNTCKLRTRGVGEGGLNALRVSTQIYNTYEEVNRTLEAVRTTWKG
jgi:selenocysteine lyase/cysteine desulfurase